MRTARTAFAFGSARRRPACIVARTLVVAATLAIAPLARADLVTMVNAMRTQGCTGQPASGAPVRPNNALDDVAHELSRSNRLSDAIERVGYPAQSSTSLHVKGAPNEDTIRRELAARYCAAVNDPKFAEVGVFRSRDEVWIVLAARRPAPPHLEAAAVAARVLELVNAARAEARKCGTQRFDAAPPVTPSGTLTEVASLHSRDMAEHRSLDHRGSDGSAPAERVTRSGYSWRGTGENVAAGQRDADAVVAAWLESPGHCVNIMEPGFTEMGVAFALAPLADPSIYWTQVFAAPRAEVATEVRPRP